VKRGWKFGDKWLKVNIKKVDIKKVNKRGDKWFKTSVVESLAISRGNSLQKKQIFTNLIETHCKKVRTYKLLNSSFSPKVYVTQLYLSTHLYVISFTSHCLLHTVFL